MPRRPAAKQKDSAQAAPRRVACRKLMSLAEFAETYYTPASRPSAATLRRWADASIAAEASGQPPIIPAVKMGKAYFVDQIKWEAQDDDLVLSVLNG